LASIGPPSAAFSPFVPIPSFSQLIFPICGHFQSPPGIRHPPSPSESFSAPTMLLLLLHNLPPICWWWPHQNDHWLSECGRRRSPGCGPNPPKAVDLPRISANFVNFLKGSSTVSSPSLPVFFCLSNSLTHFPDFSSRLPVRTVQPLTNCC
jgi:hypothetical protein